MRVLLACLLLSLGARAASAQEPPTVLLDVDDGPGAPTATAEVVATVWRMLVAVQLDARTARPVEPIERHCRLRKHLTETRGYAPYPHTATLSADVTPDFIVRGKASEGVLKLRLLDAKGREGAVVEEPWDGSPGTTTAVGFWLVEDLVESGPLRPWVADVARERIRKVVAEHYPRAEKRRE